MGCTNVKGANWSPVSGITDWKHSVFNPKVDIEQTKNALKGNGLATNEYEAQQNAIVADNNASKAFSDAIGAGRAQLALAPEQFSMYEQYLPKYTNLETSTMGKSMFGNDWTGTATDLYSKLYDTSAASNLNLINKYGGSYSDAIRSQNPELYKQMNAQDSMIGNLSTADGSLSAQDTRDAQQSARTGYAARGLAGTNSSLITEAMNTDAMKRQRLQEGIAARQASIANWQSNKVNPWDVITGSQNSGQQGYSNLLNTSGGTGNQLLSGFGSGVDTLFNAAQSARNAQANNSAASNAGMYQAGAGIAGALIIAF